MSNPLPIPTDSGIYKITNTVNGHLYVGSAVSLLRRYHQHFTGLRRGVHKNPHLQAAFRKYGESAFVFTVIEIVENKEDLIAHEQFFIDTLNPQYNVHRIAGSSLGYRASKETRAKLSNVTKLTWESESHRKRMSEAAKRRAARGISEETRARISAGHKKDWETRDRTVPDDVRAKISNTLKGKPQPWNVGRAVSEETRAKMRGRVVSEESRRKMSEAAKKRTGRFVSEETRRKIAESNKGKTLSEETREKMSEALKGRTSPMEGKKHSEETRRKMSEAKKGKPGPLKGRKVSEETRAKQREAKLGKALAPEHRTKIAEKNRQRQAQARAQREQEQLAKEQALLARWENIEPSEPIDPNAYTPLTLWDIIEPTS